MASRSIDVRQLILLLLPLALSACVQAPPPPAPVHPPAPIPAAPPPLSGDWRDWPLAAGSWRYVPGAPISSAVYGELGAPQFIVRCDAALRRVTIMRAGVSTELVITTSGGIGRFPAGHLEEAGLPMTGAVLVPTDAFLDQMLFSRGRISVASPGLQSLAIPAWAEPARAIEDCRK